MLLCLLYLGIIVCQNIPICVHAAVGDTIKNCVELN